MSLQKQQQSAKAEVPAMKVIKAYLKSERVQAMLREVPNWRMQNDALGLNRVRSFPTSEIAVSFAAFAEKLATHSKVTLSAHVVGGKVLLSLHNTGSRGRLIQVNDAVFAIAKQLG
jgi:pterin-4a-carbinolamine dehydratase